ncbi:hypothetical protein QBC35DRAFT_523376 [Podospora australis]|uniref:Zn(2)-C6 fungal-type domain-containing protein n=1 Tax=Podospora australis TaxID=1536484 RepID=A0AAN6WWE7_9PEZI|nr:hypothetical protein QBC35DRAFT_523376 [Podospora australis]
MVYPSNRLKHHGTRLPKDVCVCIRINAGTQDHAERHAQLHRMRCAFNLGRRRKIRCGSMPGASVCFNCKSRRTPCVSQSGDGARLHSLRRHPESDSPRNSSSEAPAPDVLENSVTDQRAPFLAVLDPSGVSPPPMSACSCTRLPEQGESICETIRAGLPSYDSIMKIALAHKGWWVRIHRAVCGMYDDTIESFPDFVRRAYTSDRPSELGGLGVPDLAGHSLCGRGSAQEIMDDLSQRRSGCAFNSMSTNILFRRRVPGLKLMISIKGPVPGWSPYRFVDMHHQHILEVKKPENDYLGSTMTIRCAMIAGKVLDRNHSRTKAWPASISKTMELDEAMNELATCFPETWWEQVPDRVQADGHDDFDEIQMRLHQQLFFLPPATLHLPAVPRQKFRRNLCAWFNLQAGGLYGIYRRRWFGSILLKPGMSSASDGNEMGAVLSLIWCLQRQQNQENCPIASQCRKTLTALLSRSSTDEEVRIPFFGTVVKKGDPTVEQTAQADDQSFMTNLNTGESHVLPAADQPSSSATGTSSAPASEEDLPALPSSGYSEAPWGMEHPGGHMPELGFFLLGLEDVPSADFDTGWEFIMDLDSF